MSSTTSKISNTVRLAALETGLAAVVTKVDGLGASQARIDESLATLLALVSGKAPVTQPEAQVEVAQVEVAQAPVAPVEVGAGKVTRLSKEAFRALKTSGQVPWLMTQKEAREAGLIGDQPVVIAEVVASAPAKAKAPKATKAPAERGSEPEYGTEAWIKWARVTDDGAPRRADGSVTPKAEWLARMGLAASGLFDAKQIDAAMSV